MKVPTRWSDALFTYRVGQRVYLKESSHPVIIVAFAGHEHYGSYYSRIFKVVTLTGQTLTIPDSMLRKRNPNVSRSQDEDYPEGNAPGSRD